MIFLVFMLPIGLYCFLLAYWNRGRHPVVVRGVWDFAALLFALSGLLLVGGPAILTASHERWRYAWLLGRTTFLSGQSEEGRADFWIAAWAAYFVIVLFGSIWLLLKQRNRTSVYHVDADTFSYVLSEVVRSLDLQELPMGRQTHLLRSEKAGASTSSFLILRWDASQATRSVSMLWLGPDQSLRDDVEQSLRSELSQTTTSPDSWSLCFDLLGLFFVGLSVAFFCAFSLVRILRLLP